MLVSPLISSLVMLSFGVAALRLNAKRATNQVLSAVCFVSALMFAMQLVARYVGTQYAIDHTSSPLLWVRLRYSCIGLLCPFMVWTCFYVVSGQFASRRNLAIKLLPWAVISLFLIIAPFSDAFKPSDSRPDNLTSGPLYTVYFVVMLACEIAVCVASIATARRLTGIRRLEFRFITIAFIYLSSAASLAALAHSLNPDIPWLLQIARMLAVLVFVVFGISSWCVTSRRVYHSGQVLLPLAERGALAALIALLTCYLLRWIPAPEDFWAQVAVVALACVAFFVLDERLREFLDLTAEQQTRVIARRLHDAAKGEFDPERLVTKFEDVLSGYVVGSRVRILSPEMDHYQRGDLVLTSDELRLTPLASEGWVSTASLGRESKRAESQAFQQRLEDELIHLLVSPHCAENDPGVIVAFDERENGLPFTHPEIRMLLVLAEVVDGFYTRTRFSLQARQAEQLATIGLVGAELAHELRNPIAVVDTFAQLLPTRLADVQFLREFGQVVPGEVKRIHALIDQLVDLARPRKYVFAPIDVHEIISESIALLKQEARAVSVRLHTELGAPNSVIVGDAHAIRQVLLNLLLNSMQSIRQRKRPGTVFVRTCGADGKLMIEVEDDGPGIPESIRARLFRPFVSAGKEGGLGLGLAICAQIAKVHHGRISAETRSSGALFTIALPVIGPNSASVSN